MGVIRVGGIYGVGKTRTITEAARLSDKDVRVIKGSDIMADFLGCTPEELKFQPADARQKAREHSYKVEASITDGVKW